MPRGALGQEVVVDPVDGVGGEDAGEQPVLHVAQQERRGALQEAVGPGHRGGTAAQGRGGHP